MSTENVSFEEFRYNGTLYLFLLVSTCFYVRLNIKKKQQFVNHVLLSHIIPFSFLVLFLSFVVRLDYLAHLIHLACFAQFSRSHCFHYFWLWRFISLHFQPFPLSVDCWSQHHCSCQPVLAVVVEHQRGPREGGEAGGGRGGEDRSGTRADEAKVSNGSLKTWRGAWVVQWRRQFKMRF